MKAPKSGKRKRIDWQRIIKEGTGFFGWPSLNIPGLAPLAFEARQGTWNRMAQPQATGVPLIEEAESLGADGDFLRACCLYLSEIAVEHHQSQDILKLSNKPIHLGGIRETLKHHEGKLRKDLKALESHWIEAKEALLCHTPTLARADVIDDTLSQLREEINSLIRVYSPLGKQKRTAGRPDEYYPKLVLSGMAWHLKDKIKKPRLRKEPARHSLLSKMAKCVPLSLPIAVTPNRLKTHISRHREKHLGRADFDALMREFRTMCRKFQS